MRRSFLLIILLAFTAASGCAKKEKPVVQIDDIEISKSELWQAYQTSAYYQQPASNFSEFFEQYLTKKVILREAERLDLDRNPQFLAEIQQHWEQGLLKLMLTQKNEEFGKKVSISDSEIEEYRKELANVFLEEEVEDVRPQIQSLLRREKQRVELEKWVKHLREKTEIDIDQEQLQALQTSQMEE